MINILLIGIGGFLGAIARYITVNYIKRRSRIKLPIGTLTVNLLGSFLLGYLLGMDGKGSLFLFLGTGFMGAFTTFSTFKLEAIQLVDAKEKRSAFSYIILTYAGGITLAFLGMILARM
ncbi:fluoride efflux transporter CrcB [Bacillus sp. FJAT-29790]|uniref:fluoride efflux transporter CrcB n=1 Tax=Bacillus sp. FJAT-29790 TaxID=1895002 RepID=UPI001C22FA4A|nr:fluoride efflux transporter CrcB [Bacillus sp. FJAT-29790]MBU8878344.1 fluoride efflux transporter CrcB [Bacillus sp. FJAT-29790]